MKNVKGAITCKRILAIFCIITVLQTYILSFVNVAEAIDEELNSNNRYCYWRGSI
jgi:hypothetical protein